MLIAVPSLISRSGMQMRNPKWPLLKARQAIEQQPTISNVKF
jgi:hypothetical protein